MSLTVSPGGMRKSLVYTHYIHGAHEDYWIRRWIRHQLPVVALLWIGIIHWPRCLPLCEPHQDKVGRKLMAFAEIWPAKKGSRRIYALSRVR